MEKGLVFVEEGKVVTDSLTVAEVFGKKHGHVLRDIETQIQKLHEADEYQWGVSNFGETQFQNEQNSQWYKKYNLSEDAFAIIAMSYVTVEAMKFKIKFICEFKRMKEQMQNHSSLTLPKSYKEALLALVEQVEQNEKLQTHNLMLEQVVAENEPKITYYDEILKTTNAVAISQIAKDYGLTAQDLNTILQEKKIQHKVNLQWLLNKEYHGLGYTKSKTFDYIDNDGEKQANISTRWTQKGRLFIHKILLEMNIVPFMDKMAFGQEL